MTKHLAQQELLRHLDGELSIAGVSRVEEHLHACWSCQAEFGRIKQEITTIIDAHRLVFEPSLPSPPKPWPRLEPKLQRATQPVQESFWSRFNPFVKGFHMRMAYGTGAVALLVIVAMVTVFVRPISAEELLRRAAAADSQRLAISDRQLVRQKVRITKNARGTASAPASLECWKSVRNVYWDSGADSVSSELLRYYKMNGLDSALPISPSAIESWSKIAGGELTSSQTGDSIELRVASRPEARSHGLEEVRFHLRSENWHVDEITLAFSEATYRVVEEESSVISRDEAPRGILAILGPSESETTRRSVVKRSSGPDPQTAAVDLDELELKVRYDLHSIGADLGQGVEVSAQPPDRILIEMRQASPQIKERVKAWIANQQDVDLKIHDTDSTTASTRSPTKVIPQGAPAPIAPDARLKAYFGDQQVQDNCTHETLEGAGDILEQLYDLTSLGNRWPAQAEDGLSAEAKSRLATIVRDHAHGTQTAVLALERLLDPLMNHFGYSRVGIPERSRMTWQRASTLALESARRVDAILRALLTSSDRPVALDDALPQLRQYLRDLELATRELSVATR